MKNIFHLFKQKFSNKSSEAIVYDDRWFFPTLNRPGVIRRWIIGTISLIVFGTINADSQEWAYHFISLCQSWGVLSFFLLICFGYGGRWLRKLPIGWSWVSWIVMTITFSLIMGSVDSLQNYDTPIYIFLLIRLGRDILFVCILLFLFDGQHRRGSASWVKTRLDNLQTRMRPHFLFNILNNLAEIVRTEPDKAEDALLDLADISRSMLRQDPEIKAVQEKEQAEAYIRLEKIRFEDRLKVEWEWDLEDNVRLPALMLQPLIENAIKYGVEPSSKSEKPILIKGWNDDSYVYIMIKNSMIESTKIKGNGITLPNLEERLQWLYPNKHWFRIKQDSDYFEVIMKIPYKTI